MTGSGEKAFAAGDGRVVETAWDVANVALGVGSLIGNIAAGNVGGAIIDAGGLVLDVGATAVPGVPGGAGTAIQGVRAARLAANARFGRAFEDAVLNAVQFSKNTKRVEAASGVKNFRIPDGLARGVLLDVKGVKKLSLNSQVSDFLDEGRYRR